MDFSTFDLKERIKEANPIEEVIGEVITLKKRGRVLVGAHHTHGSESGTSFNVDPQQGLNHCWNCGEGGDVFTWVMNTQSCSFPEALRILAQRAGIPLPEREPEERAKQEALWQERRELEKVFLEAARFYHSQLTPELKAWAFEKWGLLPETLDRYLVGFAPVDGAALKEHLKAKGFAPDLLKKTGLFVKAGSKGFVDFFQGRLIFPYWQSLPVEGGDGGGPAGGIACYFIGRQTEFTPDHPWEAGKYKKQLTHSEGHPYVSQAVANYYFYGEHSTRGLQDGSLFVTEGVADCLAALQVGLPAISPCTTSFSSATHERLLRLCAKARMVYLVNDSEESKAGEKGALATAEFLETNGVNARLVELPRPQGVDKVDLAEYLKDHSPEELRALTKEARTAWEIRLAALPVGKDGYNNFLVVQEFTKSILHSCPDEDRVEAFLEHHVKQKFGLKAQETDALLKEYRAARKSQEEREKEKAREEARKKALEAWKAAPIKQELLRYEWECDDNKTRPELAEKARICYNWLAANGGKFFCSETGEVWLCYQDTFYQVGNYRPFNALMFGLSDLNPATAEGRAIWEALQSLGYTLGQRVTIGGWLFTDRKNRSIYVNLQAGQLARIRPGEVAIIPNAVNEEGILLTNDPSFTPLEFQERADKRQAMRLLKQVVVDNLACPVYSRWFVTTWALTCFLMGFAGETLPLHRNSGASGEGKTWGARLISYLIYGQDMVGRGTDAANFSEGVRVPLLFEDNLEARNMTVEKRDFLLMVATGARKRKRDTKTPTGVIHEKPQALVMTTGIEPFYDQEILNRTYETEFNRHNYRNPAFVEVEAIDAITANRDRILSGFFYLLAQDVLPRLTEEQRRWKMWLAGKFPGWPKDRTNDYLATMMALFCAMRPYVDQLEAPWEEPSPWEDTEEAVFLSWVSTQYEAQEESGKETSEVVWFFEGLYREWRRYEKMRKEAEKVATRQIAVGEVPDMELGRDYFAENYRLEAREEYGRFTFLASPADLFTAYNLLCKNLNKRQIYSNARQLGQRINNDKELLEAKGWIVPDSSKPVRKSNATRYYLWERREEYQDDDVI